MRGNGIVESIMNWRAGLCEVLVVLPSSSVMFFIGWVGGALGDLGLYYNEIYTYVHVSTCVSTCT